MAPAPVSGPRRSLAAALAFLAAAVTAGIALVPAAVEYRLFGMVEGVFSLLLAYLLVYRGAWERPATLVGWVALGYATLATAQILELLLPPPGMLEWMVVAAIAVTAWAALAGGTRRRLVFSLGTLALLLAVLRYSVIPVLWARMGPAAGSAFGLGDLAESFRRMFADYRPLRPGGEAVGVLAIGLWVLGTRLLWPTLPGPEAAPAAEEEAERTAIVTD